MTPDNEMLQALNAVAYNCNPEDCEWTDPVAARKFIWDTITKVIGKPVDPEQWKTHPLKDEEFPEGVKRSISPQNIIWTMPWDRKDEHGNRVYPDKPETELMFEKEPALAMLLINEVCFLNSNWFKKDWPEEAKKKISINVNCSDLFAWGCSDAETLDYKDIEEVYKYWLKDPNEGTNVWCMIRRKQMPQRPVEKAIRAAGVWDLDALQIEHGLKQNHYDGVSGIFARHKYAVYSEWAISKGEQPVEFNGAWWRDGWNKYVAENPDWNSPEFKAVDEANLKQFKIDNGYATEEEKS